MSWLPKLPENATKLAQAHAQDIPDPKQTSPLLGIEGEMEGIRSVLADWIGRNALDKDSQAQNAVLDLEHCLKSYLERNLEPRLASTKMAQVPGPRRVPRSPPPEIIPPKQVPQPDAVGEAMESLKSLLHEWLKRNMLDKDAQAQRLVVDVGNRLRPFLEKSLKGMPSLEERLETAFPKKMEKHKPSQEGIASPDLLKEPLEMIPGRSLASLASKIAKLADDADVAGLEEHADALSGLLPKMGLLKMAQYEGSQHYWIMNGRAFEKSWREKRKKKHTDDSSYHGDDPDFYRSAHDCWWETLEEYQESLLGDHKEWLQKYAGKRRKKDGKETEEGSGMGPSTTMSREMQEKHREMESEGESPGEGIVNWLDEQNKRASGLVLMEKIAGRMEKGSSPGVAFYQSMEEMISGKYLDDVVRDLSEAVANVKTAANANGHKELSGQADDVLVSLAQVGDWMRDLWTGTKGYTGWGGGEGVGKWRTGPMVSLVQKIRKNHPAVAEFLRSFRGQTVPRDIFERNVKPVLDPYYAFIEEAKKRGVELNYPDLLTWRGKKSIDPKTMDQFIDNFDKAMTSSGLNERTAVEIQKGSEEPTARRRPEPKAKPKGPTPEQIEEALKVQPKAVAPTEAPATLEFPGETPAPVTPAAAPAGAPFESIKQPKEMAIPEEAEVVDYDAIQKENASLKARIQELERMLAAKGQPARRGPSALVPA